METLITLVNATVTRFLDMRRKRLGLMAVKKHVAKELLRDPYWREKLDNASSTAEAIQIIRDFGKAKSYSTDADES